MTDWWRALEDELERRGDVAPDPWAGIDVTAADVALTSAQRAFLEQVTSTSVPGVDDDHDPLDFDDNGPGAGTPDDEQH